MLHVCRRGRLPDFALSESQRREREEELRFAELLEDETSAVSDLFEEADDEAEGGSSA